MPKKAKELSGLVVSRLKSEGMYAVGGVDGLYLRIRNQSRAWVLCVAMGTRINNLGRTVPRRLNMGLGPYRKSPWPKRVTKRVSYVNKSVMVLIPFKKNTSKKPGRKYWPGRKDLCRML